jgi:hypothetical protein
MLKKLLITTAMGGLMISSAFAQSTMDSPKPSAPAANSPSMSAPSKSETSTSMSPSSQVGDVKTITAQGANQWLASKVKGTDVLGPDDAKVGDVNDILLTQDGRVDAYIVGVGGFLGIGTKNIALAPASFQTVNDKDTIKLKITMTKDQLKEYAAFEPKKDTNTASQPATSTTGSGSTRPATPGGMR